MTEPKDWNSIKPDKKSVSGKGLEEEMNKHMSHKFREVVIRTLLKKGKKEEFSEKEKCEKNLGIPEDVGVCLNLSKKNLKEFPEELLERMQKVKYLYLEGNNLTQLPPNFFQSLPSLKWLDLRENSLTALPTNGLKDHPSLEVLLLQGNQIKTLPTELAKVASLKGLQTSGNPIVNVPTKAMAGGFRGVIDHLGKLQSQSDVLLPVSEPIVVKPSTSRDDATKKSTTEPVNDPTDSELRMWDLEKLSQWRQFMKKPKRLEDSELKYYITKSTTEKPEEPKISVSVRSQPKIPSRPVPFRCGVYNKNRHKVSTSALRYSRLRKTRLGYKRKPITIAMIQDKARKEACRAQVREVLEKQARKIQRMRDKEVLKSWRDHARISRQHMKLLDNYQQYPSKDFASKTPFDTDPEFLNMLNRVDLYRSLKEYDNRSKRKRKPKVKITSLDLEKQMAEIMTKLQQLDTNEDEDTKTPRTKQTHVCNKMSKIMDIQKTLKRLTALNSSMSGITPLIIPKPKPKK